MSSELLSRCKLSMLGATTALYFYMLAQQLPVCTSIPSKVLRFTDLVG